VKTFDLRDGGEHRDAEFSLWVRREQLAAGEELFHGDVHGDEAAYVRAGSIRYEGREVEAGGVVVIEAGVVATLTAGDDGATIVHFGPVDPQQPVDGAYGAPSAGPRGVHLIGPRGLLAIEEPGRSTRFFADSACDTCRITLFSTARDDLYRSASHSHSEDEILYVLDGEIRVGGAVLEPDMGAAIPGNEVYGFRSGDRGFRFLNYRRDVSTYRSSAQKIEALERPRDRPDISVVDDLR
jgi:quercetin dioxygenase-like cupin family protein